MKKLKLDADELTVESFSTWSGMEANGTVRGFGTQAGNTCDPVDTCGPQTCGQMACVVDTDFPCGNPSVGCPGTTGGSPSGMLSCVGCTTQNYTNVGGDSCDYCMSFFSDSPARCPCP